MSRPSARTTRRFAEGTGRVAVATGPHQAGKKGRRPHSSRYVRIVLHDPDQVTDARDNPRE
ncbi:hypothetical protein GCM10027521_57180 [Amycolatopsis cihanbeyliensis]